MPPDIYRKLFKPRHTILCDYVKKHSQMHTFLHSCGSIYKLLPDLIEAGFEVINPVQINSRDMEPPRPQSGHPGRGKGARQTIARRFCARRGLRL